MSDYAYLYDRVQMGLGKPQHWGPQAKCEKGKPVLYPVDDPAGLDLRCKELFMPPVREYLQNGRDNQVLRSDRQIDRYRWVGSLYHFSATLSPLPKQSALTV